MQGYRRTFLATLATLLLANAVFAQEIPPVSAPVITNVTPGDRSGVIGFVPSRVTEGTPPVREYTVSCESPRNRGAGVIETTADVEGLIGNSVDIQGLTNGDRYECTMIARSVTGGLVPRSINSEISNPSPVFTPSASGGPTIFVRQDLAEDTAPSPVAEAPAPSTVEQPEEPEATTAVEPPTEEALEITEEPAVEPIAAPLVVDVPTAMPLTTSLPPSVEEVKDAPISSAVRAAVSAIVAGVVAAAFVV